MRATFGNLKLVFPDRAPDESQPVTEELTLQRPRASHANEIFHAQLFAGRSDTFARVRSSKETLWFRIVTLEGNECRQQNKGTLEKLRDQICGEFASAVLNSGRHTMPANLIYG